MMIGALRKKLAAKAARTNLLRPISRFYMDLEVPETLPPEISNNKPKSPEFPRCVRDNGQWLSPWPQDEKGFSSMIKWSITPKDPLVFADTNGASSHTVIRSVPVNKLLISVTEKPHVTWIGHATCYFQLEGMYFLTDPIFSETCSPIETIGPRRTSPPAAEVEDLRIDVCLLSHTHYDHLDIPSAVRIGNRALWIVPIGVKSLMREIGITNCIELNWWDRYIIRSPLGRRVEVIFTPTKHWTGRTLFDRNAAMWGSFAVLGPRERFFFSGDTAYCDVFKTIGKHLGPFDMSAIAIGAYKPRWLLKDVHCDPAEAVQIHQDLGSKQSMGIHWGTFPLSDEDPVEPALELARCRQAAKLSVNEFFTMAHGETVFFGGKPRHDFAARQPRMLDTYIKHFERTAKKFTDIITKVDMPFLTPAVP